MRLLNDKEFLNLQTYLKRIGCAEDDFSPFGESAEGTLLGV